MSKASFKPVLYWDRDCAFCRAWAGRWREITGDSVSYEVLQTAPQHIIEAAGGLPPHRMVVSRDDGSLATGAEAALTALAPHCRRAYWLLGLYRAFPPFAMACEAAYRLVATHRGIAGFFTRMLWGPTISTPHYGISGWFFPRAAGLVFLAAFLSLRVQIDGLTGSHGILPVGEHLAAVENHFRDAGSPGGAWLALPSLLWLGSSDASLHAVLGAGIAASLLLVLGIMPAFSTLIAWACYLSFASTVPAWLEFQWDTLLLEAGLLTTLYVPWRLFLARGGSEPPRWGRLLVWWLLFRLMFEAGIVKLQGYDANGVNAWLNGTALDFHYFTQPIPAWTSWWAAQLPAWLQRISLAGVFVIELVLPFFIFGPRRMRMAAFWGFSLLMVLIMGTGNYGFFNLLTLTLCLSLVDDASWPRTLRNLLSGAPRKNPLPRIQHRIVPWLSAVLLVPTTCTLFMVLRVCPRDLAHPIMRPFMPFMSTNSYGLFSVMTTERPEITIEASTDGIRWEPYHFRYKMDAARNSLPLFTPHMPRLDWLMWFAALEYRANGRPPAWMMPLLKRLQEGSPAVKTLLLPGGAADFTPRFFRLKLDLLHFTTPEERHASGMIWKAAPLPADTIEGSLP